MMPYDLNKRRQMGLANLAPNQNAYSQANPNAAFQQPQQPVMQNQGQSPYGGQMVQQPMPSLQTMPQQQPQQMPQQVPQQYPQMQPQAQVSPQGLQALDRRKRWMDFRNKFRNRYRSPVQY